MPILIIFLNKHQARFYLFTEVHIFSSTTIYIFGVIDEAVVHDLGFVLASDDNRPSDQGEAAERQAGTDDVLPGHAAWAIGIPPVPVVAHAFMYNLKS